MDENYKRLLESTKKNISKQKKAGRPKKLESEKKQYHRLSISVTEEQYDLIQGYADDNHEGKISALFRALCREKIEGFK